MLTTTPEVQLSFMERPPGSLASATVTASAASVLLMIACSAEDPSFRYALSAMLLAFPATAAVFAGFSSTQRIVGSLLVSRVSLIGTFLLSVAGVLSLAGIISGLKIFFILSAMNTVTIAYWWTIRSVLYARLLKDRTEEP